MQRIDSSKREQAATILAAGTSVPKTAKECGFASKTLYTRLTEDAEFKQLVRQYRGRLIDKSLGHLTRIAAKAARALEGCLGPDAPDAVKVRAASAVLERMMSMRSVFETEERLAELERRVMGGES